MTGWKESRPKFESRLERETSTGHGPVAGRRRTGAETRKCDKGARRMPGLPEARKDAAGCENPRGGASGPGSAGVRMGQPGALEARHPIMWEANPTN